MFKPRKPQEELGQPSNRLKLPLESGVRSLSGIKELLATAEAQRGCQVELPWSTDKVGQVFVLDVQWDTNMADPVWSLYEENSGQSNRLWSESFAVGDIEILYDVIVMSSGAALGKAGKNLAEIFKAQPTASKEDLTKVADNKSPALAEKEPNKETPKESPKEEKTPGPAYPMPSYAGPPGVTPIASPVVYPQVVNPENLGQPMGSPSMVPPAGWQFNQPIFNQPPAQPAKPTGGVLSNLPIDASLLNKQNDASLIDLLIKADLLTERVVEAALKIQDLIQEGRLNVDQAAEILKLHHITGEAIEDYIDPALLSSPAKKKSTVVKPGAAGGAKQQILNKEMSAAFELLQKAGLLSKEDMKTAENVKNKHGGDLVSILRAALKLDAKTLDAALTCVELEKSGSLKLEQCVIALNYCSRSRVSFDEALDELQWQNPKYLKKE